MTNVASAKLVETDGWLVVETQPRKETFALANLERQSFRTFHPRFWKTRRHARRTETVLTPLFPGYLFVKPDDEARSVRALSGTYGVRRLVSHQAGRPARVPQVAMAVLLARCEGQIVQSVLQPEVGSQVRLINGPLVDCLATVESSDAHGRVAVLVELLSQTVRVKVDHSAIGPG